MRKIMEFLKDEEGAAGVEYGILVAAIAAGIVLLAFSIGDLIESGFTTVNSALDSKF